MAFHEPTAPPAVTRAGARAHRKPMLEPGQEMRSVSGWCGHDHLLPQLQARPATAAT